MVFSIFTSSTKLVLPLGDNNIDTKLVNTSVSLGNYTYRCEKTIEGYEFIPKADSFPAGNGFVPYVKATTNITTDNRHQITLNGRVSFGVKIFTFISMAFLLVLLVLLLSGFFIDGVNLVGVLIDLIVIISIISVIKVSLFINMHLFKSALKYELGTTEAL